MEYTYKYETHLHTREASACASCGGAEYVDIYLRLGYTGIIVTDHFFNGNCAVPKELPWEERVNRFFAGYEAAKAEGDKKGLQVFFGWEANYDGDEYLIYGPDKEWLLKHPEIMSWSQAEQLEHIHEAGGLVVQAHPFRERDYLSQINLHPFHADAFEVCNAGNVAAQDVLAYHYAGKEGMSMTSGSDIHRSSSAAFGCFGMVFNKPLKTIYDYVHAVKNREGYRLITSPERMGWSKDCYNKLPINLFDEAGKSRPVTFDRLMQKTADEKE